MGSDYSLSVIALLLSLMSLFATALALQLSRKQLSFSAITNCTARFQAVLPELRSSDVSIKIDAVRRYVDLCNEQAFYIKHKYVPDEIADEWLEGMIYYLPHFKNGENVNTDESCLSEIIEHELLDDYPRLKNAFTVSRAFDLGQFAERRALVRLVKRNLRRSKL